MGVPWIGSVNQYTKALARKTQWTMKKQSGNYGAHLRSLQDAVSFTKASDRFPYTDERDDKLTAIVNKAQMGKKLSPEEWDYLRAKYPQLYEKLREVEKEQKAYEEELRRCKTRDEAQRLHVSKLGEIMAAAKNGDESALYRLNRMTQTMTAYTESREYRKLPTEAEQAVQRERARRAQEEEAPPPEEAEKPEAGREPISEEAEETPPMDEHERASAPAEPETADGKEPPPQAVPFGPRAYLDQQEQASRPHPRRRHVDAEA